MLNAPTIEVPGATLDFKDGAKIASLQSIASSLCCSIANEMTRGTAPRIVLMMIRWFLEINCSFGFLAPFSVESEFT